MNKDKIEVVQGNKERRFLRCYLDFMDCTLLSGDEKLLFLTLKRFMDIRTDQGEVFPSLETVQKLTGWGRNKVIRNIKALQKKGVLTVKRRGLTKNNLYILRDKADMWKSQTVEELRLTAEETNLNKAIRLIEEAGGQVTFPDKEKELRSDAKPTKAATELSTLSINHLTNNPTGKKAKSQERKNQFHNFDQREYDYDELEKKLINRKRI